ncbi:MAG: cytosine permease [Acidobacteria bacterium]|nr:cytosine permease [Acidobacteriota bacterium]
MLPDYISKAVPNPQNRRAPWYVNTAPTYAGIFLWIAFYKSIAGDTLTHGGVAICLAGLAAAGLLSYALYYYVPGILGMKTGFPLYVIGSSTFGTKGGYVMPGLLMGLLQVGWFAVGTSIASEFILKGFGLEAKPMTMPFILVGILWGYVMAYVGIKGIQYVSKVSLFLNFIPLLMLLVVFFQTSGGIAQYAPKPENANDFVAFTTIIAIVIGFFATAGAAGADFGMNSRNAKDVKYGGLVGVALATLVAGGLPILAVAGAHGINPNLGFNYDDVIVSIGGPVATTMFFLFTIASIPASCVCAFIAGNSFSTMIPGVPRFSSTMIAMTFAIILAVTGLAANLISFFTIVGASFGPICGAIAADYLLSGKKWAGPREGINFAGYGAWAIGFVVGILPFLPLPAGMKTYVQPAVLYSFVAGFLVYVVLAKAGLEPKTAPMPAKGAAA